MDVLGFINQHGVTGVNSVLLAFLFILIRSKLREMDRKVNTLWDWHNVQVGIHKSRKEQDDD